MDDHPLLLFDGVCNLCHRSVRWVLARDREERFRFASLQSEAAAEALRRAGFTGTPPDSVVLIDERGVHFRSDAAIEVARTLGFPWSMAVVGKALPRAWRDVLYDWVARNRYRWFGREATCALPTPGRAERFLDRDEDLASAGAPGAREA